MLRVRVSISRPIGGIARAAFRAGKTRVERFAGFIVGGGNEGGNGGEI